MSKTNQSVTVSLLAAALLLATATPGDAWGGRGGVFIGVGPYWGPPYPYWGYPSPYYSWAEQAEKKAMAEVRLTTEPALVSGCTKIGLASDDSVRDLRRKIVRGGGNAAVISFRSDDLKMMAAEVYRCPTATSKAQSASPPPPGTSSSTDAPPPPAGSPPPPPPGPSR